METLQENPATDEGSLENASTQELCEELFSRNDWREATIPGDVKVERGKAMKMNAQDEVGESNYVWPVIVMGAQELGEVLQNASEAYWRTHVNSFRQHEHVEVAHKHRNESTTGEKFVQSKDEHLPVVEISARNAGEVKSEEQEKMEAISDLQSLVAEGKLTQEEAIKVVKGEINPSDVL